MQLLPRGLYSECSLAALQQQHTANFVRAVTYYVQQAQHVPVSMDPENSLAAVQQQHLVEVIREITQYLRKDKICMQQICRTLAAKQA